MIPAASQSAPFQGNDRVLDGIILGVITFELFAQTTLTIAPDMGQDLSLGASAMNMAVAITTLFGVGLAFHATTSPPLDWNFFLRWDFVRRRGANLLPRQSGTLQNFLLSKTDVFGETYIMHYCRITFLPSEYGDGYRASIKGEIGNEDHWTDAGYDRLKGVAVVPSSDDTSDCAWLEFVRDRLTAQGVRFVHPDHVSDYADERSSYPDLPDDKVRGIALMLLALDSERATILLKSLSPALRASVQLETIRIFHDGKRQTDEYWRKAFHKQETVTLLFEVKRKAKEYWTKAFGRHH